LSFDYSPRPGVGRNSNGIEVYWDGELIFSARANGKKLDDFDWTTVTLEVPVTDSDARLEFRATGRSDSLGMTIDNVGLSGELEAFNPATDGGDDLLYGGDGDDTINGGAGNDAIIGGEGADAIDGGTGERDIVGFEDSDAGVTVNLDTGTGSGGEAEGDTYTNVEYIHGSTHDDHLTGDDGVNRLAGHDGDDQLYGLGGKDTLLGGRGADHMDGGDGVDTAEYDWSTEGVNVNLATGTGSGGYAEGDTLLNIENLFGSYFADVLTGDAGTNRLNGFKGDDVLNGGAGNDILVGGLGADSLNGGSGSRDAADYSDAHEGVGVDLTLGGFAGEADGDTFSGIEFVYGSSHDDDITGNSGHNRLVGNEGDDTLSGGAGNDTLIGGAGADVLDGGSGTRDTVDYQDADAGVGVNLETGGFAGEAAGDTYVNIEYVYGSDHDDDITGNSANNRLIGFDGDDAINGGDGNDYIIGMRGDDELTGGNGADVFLFKDEFDADVITDFWAGSGRTDRIWLDLAGIDGMDDLTLADTADGALVTVGSYGTILLEGIATADIHADDFIF
jgi:Ca2+-binding RTX toxin-like protein